MQEFSQDTTHTLDQIKAWRAGDARARDAVLASIQRELSHISRMLMRHERRRISINTDDLVNETLVKLLQSESLQVSDRAHLLALCANIMRHTLIDAARKRQRDKRNGMQITLNTAVDSERSHDTDLLALEHALRRLKAIDPDTARLVEMRYFGGMSIEDIAEVMNISPSSVKRQWRAARLWLKGAVADVL